MQKLLLFSFLLFLNSSLFAVTIIKCSNSGYANKTIDFYTYSDPISKKTELLFSLKFDNSGNSSAQIDIKNTSYIFSDFGVYRGMHLLEPTGEIELQLPPWKEKSFAEKKNPYFEPLSFWIKTKDDSQLNNQISDFTLELNKLTDQYFSEIYFRQSEQMYDSVVSLVTQKFSDIKSKSFLNHQSLEFKMVEVEAFRLKPKNYSSVFSGINSTFWNHPSFTRLFEIAFGGQLSFEAKKIDQKEISKAVHSNNTKYLMDHVKSVYSLSGDITKLALLKMLHDGFYSGDFSTESIKKHVNSSVFVQSKNEIIKLASKNILEKFEHLQPGNIAPIICLNDLEGNEKCSNKEKEKFKYLVFADTEMIVCKEQLKYLSNIENRFQKYLDVFVILRKTSIPEAQKFISENKIQGTIVMDVENEFIEKYKIKSFPQCHLLNEKHEVEFAHTKAPLDGFEQQFGSFLQQELFMRLRNQSK